MADESMADESMADEFKVEESMAQFRGAWHTYNYYTYISYEILKYRRKRNACNIYGGEIEISEKKKHVEDLGHDVRLNGYKKINIYNIYI